MLKIYNSLSQQKENFESIFPGKIKIYICGPTVYDFCHIGNARTYAAFDVIIRYLRWRGHEVTYVRNITDIDDKIIKRANEHNESFQTIVQRFTQAMQEDFSALGLLAPDHEPRATEYIPSIILFIQQLIERKAAYAADNGDVYYDVRQFHSYGELAHRNIDQLESGARVEINTVKNDPLDFVLWKLAKPGEPNWDSPWGAGRPGWHIECSAMSTALLGETFDIHGGGKDLIFPHHENEIAQTEAVTGKKFVNVWMHTGYLQMDKEKMSKSLGNFLTVRDLLQDHHPEVLRYFLITGHYRSPIHYSSESLEQARNALTRLYTALCDLPSVELNTTNLPNSESNIDYEQRFNAAMEDDFNTPVAFSVLFEWAHEIQRLRDKDLLLAAQQGALLKRLAKVLGILQSDPLKFLQSGVEKRDIEKIESLVLARNQARTAKNWAEADRIRHALLDLSIEVEDGVEGTRWRRKND